MALHNEFGEIAENIAYEFLKQKLYTILERNWRFGKNEIDIIAQKNDTLIIVEVKARKSNFFEEPQDAVGRNKQKRTVLAADAYIQKKEIDLPVQYDIIAITGSEKKHKLEHIEDAFVPEL